MPSYAPSQYSTSMEGNLPLLIERLCERFIDTTFPVAKERLMPFVKQEIDGLYRAGKLDVSEGLQLCGGIIWDAVRKYWEGRL